MWYEWFFQGIGTEIILIFFGIVCGFRAYKYCLKKTAFQKQIAKDGANQNQELEISTDNTEENCSYANIRQVQKASSNSIQSQVGKIRR